MSNQERVAERRKHWGELIARQQQSGKTVKAFCEENGVGGPSFLCIAEAHFEQNTNTPTGCSERQPAATYHRYVLPRSSHHRPLNYKNWRSRAENPT
jgi:hypothetical protein